MLASTWRGFLSERRRKAITTATTSLVHRLNDIRGISDHKILMSQKPTKIISHAFSLMALDQLKFLFASKRIPMQRSNIKNARSNGLPLSMSCTWEPNHTPRDLVQIDSIQMVRTQDERATSGACFCSILRRKTTKIVPRSNAKGGGIFTTSDRSTMNVLLQVRTL